jgi:hypothetical protein
MNFDLYLSQIKPIMNNTIKQKLFAPLFILILLCLFTATNTRAVVRVVDKNVNVTQPPTDTINNDTVFVRVDKQPSFPGGPDAYLKFLSKSIKYPEVMRDRQIEDDVNVQFIVEIDGSLSHIRALNSPGYGTAEEAVRVMKLSPKWRPAYKNGRAVRILYKAPVVFRLKFIEHKANESSGMKVISGR